MDSEPWDHSTFSKNRERLINDDVVRKLFVQVLEEARLKQLLSKEHFSVDGMMKNRSGLAVDCRLTQAEGALCASRGEFTEPRHRPAYWG
jgi:hypothetical protein